MAAGTLRSIRVQVGHDQLSWRFGQEPEVIHVETTDGPDRLHVPVRRPELVALAERLAQAAAGTLRSSPLEQVDLAYSGNRLSGGCWWTVLGGPDRSEFKPATLARIAQAAGIEPVQ